MSALLKILTHLGQLSGDLKDLETAIMDLFHGKLTKEEVSKLLQDVEDILSEGLISIPGVDSAAVVSLIQAGESTVQDVIAAVTDVKEKGAEALVPDLKKIASDLLVAVKSGVVTDFGGHSVVQAAEVLSGIIASL